MSVQLIERHNEDGFGIPAVLINSVTETNDGVLTIPDQDGLAAAIALARVLVPVQLAGPDIVAIRKACGLKAKDFAAGINMNPSTLSRIENAADGNGMGHYAETTLRIFAAESLKDRALGIDYRDARQITSMKIMANPEGEQITIELQRVDVKTGQGLIEAYRDVPVAA
jgi:DNA-binding transcriptional regulator YiaG